ncbi:hypothetical protein LHJ74_29545 [Streptomyces sp. N2-109]|uniref:Tetratricopeptide repeat protein n=1 Tax=Streptomyces gossypii TaxID=2883101 RepID=A0ABT2K1H2_9ACTN|nr:hypothetical protein [Streptomyces gossypii]MCT2594005.1 hypothetical protein [Streptomyces gossypii]
MADPQEQAFQDALMTRIGQAVMLHRGGDREEARHRFAVLWEEAGGAAPKSEVLFHRCTIAHYMADTQDDPADELEWDRRALAAADALAGERVSWGQHELAVRALYPSLHLNLAADYFKLGDAPAARAELSRARGAAGVLEEDDYGSGIRAAIDRMGTRIAGMDQLP